MTKKANRKRRHYKTTFGYAGYCVTRFHGKVVKRFVSKIVKEWVNIILEKYPPRPRSEAIGISFTGITITKPLDFNETKLTE